MLERFGTSIRAEKARASLYRLRQDEMTVLQYAHVFESYLAQLGDYDESYYLAHFIFGLRPEIMRGVYIQQLESLPAAKNMAKKLELTHLATSERREHTNRKKTSKAQRKAPKSGGAAREISRRLAKSVHRGRRRKQYIHTSQDVNLLSQEQERRAVWMDMDQQLCGDPF